MYRAFVVLVSLLLLCISCGSTTTQRAPETPAPVPPPAVFVAGQIPPIALLMLGDGAAIVQDIAAENERIRSVQLMVATGANLEHPLLVEIRSPDLMVRYGVGSIQTNKTDPAWVSVDIDMLADLEIGRAYALVLTSTKSSDDAWWVGVGDPSTYPYGRIRQHQSEHALAFRAEYTSGTLTQSMLALPNKPPNRLTMRQSARHRKIQVDAYPHTGGRGRPPNINFLPECIGMLCADYSSTLIPDAKERKKRASRAFEFCSTQSDFPIARETNPELGISCRDVCAANSYACAATVSLQKDTCEVADERTYRDASSSCDVVVSSIRDRDKVGCVCAPATQISFDVAQEDIEKVVREGFYLDGDTPRIIQGKTPYGVTCSDVCLTLIDAAPFDRSTASEAITPWAPTCKCRRREAHTNSTAIRKLGDYALIPWRGKSYVYDFKKQSVRKVRHFDGHTQTKGRFLVWRDRDNNYSLAVDAKTGKVQRIDSKCDLHADGDKLWAICTGSLTTIQKVGSTKVVKAPPLRVSHSGLHNVTIRGQVLTVRANKATYSWKRGAKAWTKNSFNLSQLSPGWESAYLLDELLRRNPKHPQFKQGLFWSDRGSERWAYDPQKRRFLTWETRYGGFDLSGTTVNSRDGVFDAETQSFLSLRNSRDTVWFGNVGIAVECPDGHVCESLPEPLQLLKTFQIDGRRRSVRVEKATVVEVEGL